MLQRLALLLVSVSLLAPPIARGQAEAAVDFAVIVNRSSSIQMLSLDELRNIFLGEKPVWADGKKVLPVTFGSGTPELRLLLKTICKMSEADYKRYFIQMSFEGKMVTQPRFLSSSAAVRAFVGSTPGAIGTIQSNQVDPSVSVLKLNGAGPGDRAYKLVSKR